MKPRIDTLRHPDGRERAWGTTLLIGDHPELLQWVEGYGACLLQPDFRKWLFEEDPGVRIERPNVTTWVIQFSNPLAAFEFKIRYC